MKIECKRHGLRRRENIEDLHRHGHQRCLVVLISMNEMGVEVIQITYSKAGWVLGLS